MNRKLFPLLSLFSLIICLGGCANSQPLVVSSDNTPQGPGILSGEEGHFEINF